MVRTAGEVAAQGPDPGLRGLPDRVLDLTRALRRAGVPTAVSDGLDAQRAAAAVDLLDREQLREALAATMVTSPAHRVAFDTLFDVFFPARLGGSEADEQPREPRDITDFLAELVARIKAGDEAAIRALAAEAVESYGRVETREGTPGYYAYRVWREMSPAGLLRRLLNESGIDEQDTLARQLARDEFDARLRQFREEVESEVRRRLVAQKGADEVARRTVRAPLEDIDFFRVSSEEQAALRRSVRPLARKLASRVAVKRRRARDGRLDVRRTVRHSLSSGGVPIEPALRAKKVHRPELVVLCDVSGSVAAFARFTLMLSHALQGQFTRVRSFAFIDTVDEVTDLFAPGDFADAMARLTSEADLVWFDGHSDYGHALSAFHARYLDAVTPRSTVLILGDARNNYRAPATWVLDDLRRRGRRVYWLNPEPVAHWGAGDSIADTYAAHVDRMAECRNLRQLTQFVEEIV
jgi:uncharacterized protein